MSSDCFPKDVLPNNSFILWRRSTSRDQQINLLNFTQKISIIISCGIKKVSSNIYITYNTDSLQPEIRRLPLKRAAPCLIFFPAQEHRFQAHFASIKIWKRNSSESLVTFRSVLGWDHSELCSYKNLTKVIIRNRNYIQWRQFIYMDKLNRANKLHRFTNLHKHLQSIESTILVPSPKTFFSEIHWFKFV